ncbi:polysialyltransferase family glycosyltransferase [Psychrobacter sp. DM4]|uniref:polysialyltransferase family glycosyltransferase n=1 Tax=Psychrobacter sp. DM4 TaxID=3440637 RepID=UPI003F4FD7B4
MKNFLVYINNSEGELDWIAPFVLYEVMRGIKFSFYLDNVGNDHTEKSEILEKYGLDSNNLINNDILFDRFDTFFYKVVNKLSYIASGNNKFNYTFPGSKRRNDFFYFLLRPYLFIKKSCYRKKIEEFDVIFRDYNLKPSLALSYYLSTNKDACVVVYPHAIGIQPNTNNRLPPVKVKCDLWLENTELSLHAKDVYKKEFFVSGPPALSDARDNSLFKSDSKNILILTRNCNEEYGFNLDDALLSFEQLLNSLSKLGFNIVIKHHPRDINIRRWREIQDKYERIEEFEDSLSNLNIVLRVCLTLFSTAGIYVLAKGVPVIDYSPYKSFSDCKKVLPFHFDSKDLKVVTHQLCSLGIYEQEQSILKIIEIISDKNQLANMSDSQKKKLYTYYPTNANEVISSKLREI